MACFKEEGVTCSTFSLMGKFEAGFSHPKWGMHALGSEDDALGFQRKNANFYSYLF